MRKLLRLILLGFCLLVVGGPVTQAQQTTRTAQDQQRQTVYITKTERSITGMVAQ